MASPDSRLDTRDYLPLAAFVAAVALAYSLYGLFRHWHFDSSAYDLGIFDQVIWHLSRFEAPSSTIRGYSSLLGEHFSPILVLLAPLYWIAAGAETLIVAQAALLALSIIPVFLYARRRLPRGVSYSVTAAYALFWGMQRAAGFDFHEFAFAPLLVATAILAMDEERWALFWSSALALITVKEDLIPLIGGLGLLLVFRRHPRQGVAAIAVSCIAFVVVVGLVIPAMSETGRFGYTSTYSAIIDRPWRIPIVLVTPVIKLRTTVLLFAPFAFLPALSPLALLIPPLAVERFLSSTPNHWGTVFHYWAPIAPVLAMGTADGLARVAGYLRRRGRETRTTLRVGAGACVVLSATLPGHQPLMRIVRPTHYQASVTERTGIDVLEMIPDNATVVAQAAVVPHLSNRDGIYMLDATAPEADFVVAADGLDPWPLGTVKEVRGLVDDRRRRGYRPVFERDGWVVLRRGAPPGS